MLETEPASQHPAEGEEVRKLRRRLKRDRRARVEAEAIAEKGLRELYDKQQHLQLLESVATAANQALSVEDALQFAIKMVCQFMDWPMGHAYLTDEASGHKRLCSMPIWQGAGTEEARALRRATEDTDFDINVGLPGRVLATGAPAWIVDVAEDGNFPRAEPARRAGIRAAFSFPVLVGSEVAAVLEFFVGKVTQPDDAILRIMSQIGTQLGRVVERKRAEQQLIHDASHDPLTRLPNRALFLDQLTRAVARCRRHPQAAFAVLFIDLDRFKVINDSLGHHAGEMS